MKKIVIPLLIAGTVLTTGCQQQTPETASAVSSAPTTPVIKKEDAVAEVNGQFIAKSTLADLEKEIAERGHGQTFPKEKLIEELIQRELLVQDALQKQLDKSPEYIQQLETAKKSILTQTGLQNFLKTNPVTDAELKAEYDSKIAAETGTEYKARHILVKTEDEAKKLIAELDKGGDFAALANKHSLDAKESQNGGDLGWFVSGQMVAPFSDAVAKLEKGKYTKAPVQTQFGWHVILREDSRAQVPPPLEAVKEQLKPYLQRKKVQTMIETLRKQAKVEVLVPLVEEKPKAEAATTPTSQPAAPATAGTENAAEKAATETPTAVATKPEAAAPATTDANKAAEAATPAGETKPEDKSTEKAPADANATNKAVEAVKEEAVKSEPVKQ
jgi:peptidyl-prolyl cis-trans isomerase C